MSFRKDLPIMWSLMVPSDVWTMVWFLLTSSDFFRIIWMLFLLRCVFSYLLLDVLTFICVHKLRLSGQSSTTAPQYSSLLQKSLSAGRQQRWCHGDKLHHAQLQIQNNQPEDQPVQDLYQLYMIMIPQQISRNESINCVERTGDSKTMKISFTYLMHQY